jgi:hypothetical protein
MGVVGREAAINRTAEEENRARILRGEFTDAEREGALAAYSRGRATFIEYIRALLVGVGLADIMRNNSILTNITIRILEFSTSIVSSPQQILSGVTAGVSNIATVGNTALPLIGCVAVAVSVGWAARNVGRLIGWASRGINTDAVQRLTDDALADRLAGRIADAVATNVPVISKAIVGAAKQAGSAAVAMAKKRAPAAPAAPAVIATREDAIAEEINTESDVGRLSAIASEAAPSSSAAPSADVVALLSEPSAEVLDESIGSGGDAAAIVSLAANIGNNTDFVVPSEPAISGQKRARSERDEEEEEGEGAEGPPSAKRRGGRRTRRLRRRSNRKRAFTRRR